MYSFTRSLIGPKLARMLIQVRVVVRTTSDQRDAVDAELVLDAEGRDPVGLLQELEARSLRRIERRQQHQRDAQADAARSRARPSGSAARSRAA